MRFVETPVFTSSLRGLLSAEEYRQLQVALLLRPEQGALIRGSGGLRKLRWGAAGRGKRGGLRLIYFWEASEELFYMLYVYPKNVQDDLTPAQVRTLRRLVEEELK
jgi:mRNA-degrading endonuclease RelE of RelBE toxin-antitoxin system